MRRANYGKGAARAFPTTLCSELCENGRTDRFAVWVVDSGGPKEAKVQQFNCIRQCALTGGHIGATWRIRLNRPSVEAMLPYVKLL